MPQTKKSTVTDYINQQTIWLEKSLSKILNIFEFLKFVSVYMEINFYHTFPRKDDQTKRTASWHKAQTRTLKINSTLLRSRCHAFCTALGFQLNSSLHLSCGNARKWWLVAPDYHDHLYHGLGQFSCWTHHTIIFDHFGLCR